MLHQYNYLQIEWARNFKKKKIESQCGKKSKEWQGLEVGDMFGAT